MNECRTINKFVYLVTFMIIAISCGNENDKPQKTTDCVPEINNYDFFIEGEIEDKLLKYRQLASATSSTSNRYFLEYKETWLQAYSDVQNSDGKWLIRFHNLNIEAIELPYTLEHSEGNIGWSDSSIDLIIPDTDYCQGIDSGCIFTLIPERGNIIITKVSNQIIEGSFSGKAILVRTGINQGQDENLYHEIENGKFRINYKV